MMLAKGISARQVALLILILHIGIAVFSLIGTWALYHLEKVPDWDYSLIAFWLGVGNIATGVLVSLVCMTSHEGWASAVKLSVLSVIVAGGMELLGTMTGIPFGRYEYTDLLGPKFLGHVPYIIPLSWMMMLYPAMILTDAIGIRGVWRPLAAGFVLTIWDVAMDPAVTTGFAYWQWQTEGGFYGMPYTNWVGWWMTGALLAGIYWKVDRAWRGKWDWIPVALYLVQGGFMAGLAWAVMRPLASVLWLVLTAIVMLAVLKNQKQNAFSGEERC